MFSLLVQIFSVFISCDVTWKDDFYTWRQSAKLKLLLSVERICMEIQHPYTLGLIGLHLNTCKPSYARSYSKARPCGPQRNLGSTLVRFPKSSSILFSASFEDLSALS